MSHISHVLSPRVQEERPVTQMEGVRDDNIPE